MAEDVPSFGGMPLDSVDRTPDFLPPSRTGSTTSLADGRPLRRAGILAAAIGLCLLASGCTTTSQVSTRYYDVSGTSFRDFDREIRRKGPKNGKAIATAGLDIRPVDLRPVFRDGTCRFESARFRIRADLTLPRWREEASSRDAKLRAGWKGFAAYAKAHEEFHVKIAEAFVRELEKAFLAIPPQPSCARLEVVALELIRRARVVHEKAQLAFDASEQRRFARLAADARRRQR